jgi:hypothetical protein
MLPAPISVLNFLGLDRVCIKAHDGVTETSVGRGPPSQQPNVH